jgi:predicted flap endonuclease-1-like 5' DNA nuclease
MRMTEREMINTPSLAGWAIACAAGAFVFGVAFVAMGLGFMQAAFVAALVLVVVGVILGLMHDPLPPLGAARAEAPAAHGAGHAAPVAKAAVAHAAPVASAPAAVAPAAVAVAPVAAPGSAAPVAAAPVEVAPAAVAVAAAPAPVEAAPVAQPLMAAEPVGETAAAQPKALAAARDGKADDLKTIEGIGPVLEKLCHELGIFHFDQIAAWGPAEVAWMDGNLKGFKGRVTRDKWVAQAKIICTDGIEAFRIRAKTNDY